MKSVEDKLKVSDLCLVHGKDKRSTFMQRNFLLDIDSHC